VLGAISSLADQPPDREFQAGVALVTVDVVVTDRHGHTVPGLDRTQFRLSEDGRPREILRFQAGLVLTDLAWCHRVRWCCMLFRRGVTPVSP
jgi:hypothetical protein